MRRPRHVRAGALLALAALAAAAPLAAQRTRDQSRLVITVMPGYVWGADLWTVDRQPIFASAGATINDPPIYDTLSLNRGVRPAVGVSFSGAYFAGDHIGLTGEAVLVGVGYRDGCRLVASSGAQRPAEICTGGTGAINNAEKAATAVLLSAGAMGRINSRRRISPYARVAGGVLVSNQSSLRTIGTDDTGPEPVDVIVYQDNRSTRFTPAVLLGVGFTAQLAPGYQLRWELRDNVVGLRTVTGPTAIEGAIPPSKLTFKHLPGVFVGLDVVLERRRGRRY